MSAAGTNQKNRRLERRANGQRCGTMSLCQTLQKTHNNIPIIILGTKTDLKKLPHTSDYIEKQENKDLLM